MGSRWNFYKPADSAATSSFSPTRSKKPWGSQYIWKRRFRVSKQQGTDNENVDTRPKHQRYLQQIRLGAVDQGIPITGYDNCHVAALIDDLDILTPAIHI